MIEGIFCDSISVEGDDLVVVSGQLVYRMSAPRCVEFTHNADYVWTVYYIDNSRGQGQSFPAMIGFSSPEQRDLFRRLTSVKGLGIKTAVRAMSAPSEDIEAWIAAGDVKGIKSLDGIGAAAADRVVATLSPKDKQPAIAPPTSSMFDEPGGFFAAMWSAVPSRKKKSKAAARRAFDKAVTTTKNPEMLVDTIREYYESKEGRGKFAVMPSRWLNEGRWSDDRSAWSDTGEPPVEPVGQGTQWDRAKAAGK
jgi:Holliday junction resolvasome RuvABC DNA-binding subunit